MQIHTSKYLWDYTETTNNIYTKVPNNTITIKKDKKFRNFLSHKAQEYTDGSVSRG